MFLSLRKKCSWIRQIKPPTEYGKARRYPMYIRNVSIQICIPYTCQLNISENILFCIRNAWYKISHMIYWICQYTVEYTTIVATGKLDQVLALQQKKQTEINQNFLLKFYKVKTKRRALFCFGRLVSEFSNKKWIWKFHNFCLVKIVQVESAISWMYYWCTFY